MLSGNNDKASLIISCNFDVVSMINPFEILFVTALAMICLLYTSDAADERSSVDLGGRRIINKKKREQKKEKKKKKKQ